MSGLSFIRTRPFVPSVAGWFGERVAVAGSNPVSGVVMQSSSGLGRMRRS